MKFIDEATIYVRAGNGGKGASHFRREKFVPLGGPDGGDGGKGGDVVLIADRNKHTLLDFRFMAKWEAKNGEDGGTNRRTGKNGEDLIIKVPIGTEIIRIMENVYYESGSDDRTVSAVSEYSSGINKRDCRV